MDLNFNRVFIQILKRYRISILLAVFQVSGGAHMKLHQPKVSSPIVLAVSASRCWDENRIRRQIISIHLKRQSEAIPSFVIHHSSFVIQKSGTHSYPTRQQIS
jgi:hypothetical protein